MSVKAINDFQYHSPETLAEALTLVDAYADTCSILAGGTDLIPKLKGHAAAPAHIISLRRIEELRFIRFDPQTGLRIGALATIRELETHAAVQHHYRALYDGAHSIASTQIRNAGTIIGNICNAVPSADAAPALLVFDAQLRIASNAGTRTVPIGNFFTGVCKTVLRPDEIVVEAYLPIPKAGTCSVYYKFSMRQALDLAMVGVAVSARVDGGRFSDVRIGLGAVASTPKRAINAEKMLLGQEASMQRIAAAAACAAEFDCSPITDLRATKEYRSEMVRVLVRNALCACAGPHNGEEERV